MAGTGLDVDSVIERLLSVRGQPNNRTVQLAEGEIRALCATARCVPSPPLDGEPAFFAIPPSSRSFFPAGPQTRVLARPATASTGWMRRGSTRIEARVRIVDVWVDVAARSGASGEVARPHCPFDAPWEANHLGHCRCAGEALRLLQGRSAARVASRRPRRVRATTCGRRTRDRSIEREKARLAA